jgi:hypothetical protein
MYGVLQNVGCETIEEIECTNCNERRVVDYKLEYPYARPKKYIRKKHAQDQAPDRSSPEKSSL